MIKQFITEKQLNELSPEQLEALNKWYWTKDRIRTLPFDVTGVILDVDPKDITIGVMIEFISEHIDRSVTTLAIDMGEHEWHIYHVTTPRPRPSIASVELCDGLWKDVKNLL